MSTMGWLAARTGFCLRRNATPFNVGCVASLWLLLPAAGGQQPHSSTSPSAYASAREQALAPALADLGQKQYERALQELESVLQTYPNDSRVLMLTGNAARLSHHYERAETAYKAALANAPRPMWQINIALVQTYAAMGKWDEFNAERQLIEKSRRDGDPHLTKVSAYVIDEFEQNSYHVKTVEYLDRLGRFHVHYRFFVLPVGENPAPNQWAPHIDCESDDIDQVEFARKHPAEAAAGQRSASLDGYLVPNTHSTIKLYQDGEPAYEAIRQDVESVVAQLKPH
jgi:tetratricopeptide (TPR) repeat protein